MHMTYNRGRPQSASITKELKGKIPRLITVNTSSSFEKLAFSSSASNHKKAAYVPILYREWLMTESGKRKEARERGFFDWKKKNASEREVEKGRAIGFYRCLENWEFFGSESDEALRKCDHEAASRLGTLDH